MAKRQLIGYVAGARQGEGINVRDCYPFVEIELEPLGDYEVRTVRCDAAGARELRDVLDRWLAGLAEKGDRPSSGVVFTGGICRECGGMTQQAGACRVCTNCGASDGCG